MDDQCILLDDETDQQFEMEEAPENSNAVNNDAPTTEDPASTNQNDYSNQDSEIINDNDKFRNEDVEFISEGNDAFVETTQEENNSQMDNAEEPQEIIEISDSEINSKKIEPDTEAVSEDELPSETTKVLLYLFY